MSAGSDVARGTKGAFPPGALFAGKYRIERCLASGGMGAVYEVTHVETDRKRALKAMHAHLFESDDVRERFRREAKIAAQVESEHIVDVFDAGVDEESNTPYLVMELLKGEELGDRLKRIGPFPPGEVVTYLEQAARALDKTHSKMIIHRDLKPANLFLAQPEEGPPKLKILDFGIAKVVEDGATKAGVTRSLGTPLYMAPEQFRAGSKLTPAADIHALGMVAFALLTGEPYWTEEAKTSEDVIAFVMTVVAGPKESAVKRAAARGVRLPAVFDAWFQRITAVSPEKRYRKASEAVAALAEVLRETPVVGPAPSAQGGAPSHPAYSAQVAAQSHPAYSAQVAAPTRSGSPRLAPSGTLIGAPGDLSQAALSMARAPSPEPLRTNPGPVSSGRAVQSGPVAHTVHLGTPEPVRQSMPVQPNMPVAPHVTVQSNVPFPPNMPVAPPMPAQPSVGFSAGVSGPQSVLERGATTTSGATTGDLRPAAPKGRGALVVAIVACVTLLLLLGAIVVRRARFRARMEAGGAPTAVTASAASALPDPRPTSPVGQGSPNNDAPGLAGSAAGPTTAPHATTKPTGQVPTKPTTRPTGIPTSLIGRD